MTENAPVQLTRPDCSASE